MTCQTRSDTGPLPPRWMPVFGSADNLAVKPWPHPLSDPPSCPTVGEIKDDTVHHLIADGIAVEICIPQAEGSEDVNDLRAALRRLAIDGVDLIITTGLHDAQLFKETARRLPETRVTSIDVLGRNRRRHGESYRWPALTTGSVSALNQDGPRTGQCFGPLVSVWRSRLRRRPGHSSDTPVRLHRCARRPETAAEFGRSGLDVRDHTGRVHECGPRSRSGGPFAIGVDMNQNGVHPGTILTSVLKWLDVAVYGALTMRDRAAGKPASDRWDCRKMVSTWPWICTMRR